MLDGLSIKNLKKIDRPEIGGLITFDGHHMHEGLCFIAVCTAYEDHEPKCDCCSQVTDAKLMQFVPIYMAPYYHLEMHHDYFSSLYDRKGKKFMRNSLVFSESCADTELTGLHFYKIVEKS